MEFSGTNDGEPSARGLLQALRNYHEADCSRYAPYVARLNTIQRTLTMGEDFEVGWMVTPTPERMGQSCVIALDFTNLPMSITQTSIKSFAMRDADHYDCIVEIGFEFPLRGIYENVAGVSDMIGQMCEDLSSEWVANLQVSAERNGRTWVVTGATEF